MHWSQCRLEMHWSLHTARACSCPAPGVGTHCPDELAQVCAHYTAGAGSSKPHSPGTEACLRPNGSIQATLPTMGWNFQPAHSSAQKHACASQIQLAQEQCAGSLCQRCRVNTVAPVLYSTRAKTLGRCKLAQRSAWIALLGNSFDEEVRIHHWPKQLKANTLQGKSQNYCWKMFPPVFKVS